MSTDSLNNASSTIDRLNTASNAAQIQEISATSIRDLRAEIEKKTFAQSPADMKRLEELLTKLSSRMRMVKLAKEVAATAQDTLRTNQLEVVHSALQELSDAMVSAGIIPVRFDNPAGRVLGRIENLGDQSLQFFRAQPTWVNVVATAGIATGVVYMWTKFRSWSGAILAAGATAIAGTAAYMSIPWVRDLFNSVAERVRQGGQSAEKLNDEQQKIYEDFQKREKQTNDFYAQFVKLRAVASTVPAEVASAVAVTRQAISRESELLADATVNLFATAPRRLKTLRARIERLAVITKQLNVPPRPQNPGTPGATKQAADVKLGQQYTKMTPNFPSAQDQTRQVETKPRNERGPTGSDPQRDAEKKQFEDNLTKQRAQKQSTTMSPAGPTPPSRAERQPIYVPPVTPSPNAVPQPTQDIDPVTGLPRVMTPPSPGVVPPVEPTPMPEQNLPIPGLPRIDESGNIIPPQPNPAPQPFESQAQISPTLRDIRAGSEAAFNSIVIDGQTLALKTSGELTINGSRLQFRVDRLADVTFSRFRRVGDTLVTTITANGQTQEEVFNAAKIQSLLQSYRNGRQQLGPNARRGANVEIQHTPFTTPRPGRSPANHVLRVYLYA